MKTRLLLTVALIAAATAAGFVAWWLPLVPIAGMAGLAVHAMASDGDDSWDYPGAEDAPF